MLYMDKAPEHFINLRNSGEIPEAVGIATIGYEESWDIIQVRKKAGNEVKWY